MSRPQDSDSGAGPARPGSVRWLHAVVDVGAVDHEAAADFWGRALGWPTGPSWPGHPELRSFEPPGGTSYVHLQQVDAPARVHLDLESEAPDELVARAVLLGASLLGRQDRWRALQSPGGLPWCVVPVGSGTVPPPGSWPGGHQSRLVQVCIDSPQSAHTREVAFWRSLLDARWVGSGSPEFAGKWHDDEGGPLQLLFQGLDEPDGPVRAHLDLGTDDLQAEVRRLLLLGASDVGPGHGGWHVLRDATGQAFCVTGNSPAATRHRDLG